MVATILPADPGSWVKIQLFSECGHVSNLTESGMQQHGSKNFACGSSPPRP